MKNIFEQRKIKYITVITKKDLLTAGNKNKLAEFEKYILISVLK